jgi:S-DNA-T family DNA segregation ATPase FtsK/SpoIIIE
MAEENKTETQENVTMEVMPGADPVPEEEAGNDFKVDMNFEESEEEVEFPKEEEIEEVEELTAEEESQEGTEEVAEEEETETVAEETEDSGEETVLEDDAGDTQQPVEPVQEGVEEQKEPMIPKSRFDEVLAKQKALQKQLQEATNPVEKIENAPEYDFGAKELQYQEHILNGEADKAAALRSEIREVERKTMMFEVQQQMGQTVQQSTEAIALQNKAIEIQTAYPELDETSAEYNKDLTQEVMDLRDAFMIQGFTGADALEKAANYVVQPKEKSPTPQADPVEKEVAQKKKVANTSKKLKAAEKQPPALKGKNKVEKKVDISNMSIDEFDALPAETLRRMRGDFG